MKSQILCAALLIATAQAAQAQASKESTPVSTASSFASQFYGVEASAVDVTITRLESHTATAITKALGVTACI